MDTKTEKAASIVTKDGREVDVLVSVFRETPDAPVLYYKIIIADDPLLGNNKDFHNIPEVIGGIFDVAESVPKRKTLRLEKSFADNHPEGFDEWMKAVRVPQIYGLVNQNK